jgi:hypothetical protein
MTSSQTAKPIPPNIINAETEKLMVGFKTKAFKLDEPKLSNPALQKAETVKNILLKMPCFIPNRGIKSVMIIIPNRDSMIIVVLYAKNRYSLRFLLSFRLSADCKRV